MCNIIPTIIHTASAKTHRLRFSVNICSWEKPSLHQSSLDHSIDATGSLQCYGAGANSRYRSISATGTWAAEKKLHVAGAIDQQVRQTDKHHTVTEMLTARSRQHQQQKKEALCMLATYVQYSSTTVSAEQPSASHSVR